jgi:CcmD family protein
MTYLVVAYAFAVVVLGGYLVWSLRRVRELSGKARRER